MARRIGIIGAGIAGLVTAKTLAQFGHDVTVFEKEAELGGVWAGSRRYPGLTTQNPRETYAFADFPMPSSYPEWPTGTQMQAYLESYCDHFGFRSALRLGTQVLEVSPAGPRWRVRVCDLASGEQREDLFDHVVVCNGIFSIPSIPAFPGSDTFRQAGGQILHTSEFTDIESDAVSLLFLMKRIPILPLTNWRIFPRSALSGCLTGACSPERPARAPALAARAVDLGGGSVLKGRATICAPRPFRFILPTQATYRAY